MDIGNWILDIERIQHLSLKGCEWIKSERFQKKQAEEQKRKDKENPMRVSSFFICLMRENDFDIHKIIIINKV